MTIKKIFLFSCFLCLSFCIEAHAETEEAPNTVSAIRGAYLPLRSRTEGEHQLSRLQAHGFNTVLVAAGTFPLQEQRWLEWGKMAGTLGLDLWAVLHFAVPHELRETPNSYRPYVNRAGEIYHGTPCPLDERYWHEAIGKRFTRLADLTGSTSLSGAAFDTEMYGSEISLYYDLCYCDVCWLEFATSEPSLMPKREGIHQEARELPAEQRFGFLSDRDLLQAYTNFEWARVRDILNRMRRQIHATHPNFRLGFVGYRYTWFFSALVRGFGTQKRPVWVFSESSYVRGSTPYVDREREQVSNQGDIARYVPGLWLSRFFPRDLPSQLVDLAFHSDGYWIFNAAYLWQDESSAQKVVLHDTPDAYWSALSLTNDEVQRLSENVGEQGRTLPEVHRSSFYDLKQEQLFRSANLKFLLSSRFPEHRNKYADSSNQETTVYRGRTLFHVLKEEGEEHTIRLTSVPVNDAPQAPCSYILFDDAGQVLQQAEVESQGRTETVRLPANLAGQFSLLTDSGPNGLKVSFSEGLPYLLEASSTFPLTLFKSAARYAVYIPTGEQWMKVRAYCPETEFASLALWSAEGVKLRHMDIRGGLYGFSEMQSPLRSDTEPSFATLSVGPVVSKPFGDLRFYLYDVEFPYLFPGHP